MSKDVILHLPAWSTVPTTVTTTTTATPAKKVTVLYFITGNPGLIGYYAEFLELVTRGQKGRECVIVGASLGGFERGGSNSNLSTRTSTTTLEDKVCEGMLWPKGFERKDIYDLRDQIELCYRRLVQLIENLKSCVGSIDDATVFQVVLAGHSVGAYIALEIVRRQHEDIMLKSKSSGALFSIIATILLTPTINNISHSSSGRIAAPVLGYLPFFPSLLQLGTSSLTAILPTSWLHGIVERITRMKNAHAVNTTVGFLQTPGAVREALYMAGCEMQEIGEDQWTDEVWGAVNAAEPVKDNISEMIWFAPKHYFLFAKEDHWVADVTRDSIMKTMHDRATVLLDENQKLGLVHAWCLQQNGTVAEVVNGWIHEILDGVR